VPRLSVIGIRLALLYFLLGISAGSMLLVHKAFPLHPATWALLPLHIEFLLSGWIVQLVFAVGYWIFPRFLNEPKRGNLALAWAALAALNLSILLLVFASLATQGALSLAGRILQVLAAALFAASLWGRAKPTETGVARKLRSTEEN